MSKFRAIVLAAAVSVPFAVGLTSSANAGGLFGDLLQIAARNGEHNLCQWVFRKVQGDLFAEWPEQCTLDTYQQTWWLPLLVAY